MLILLLEDLEICLLGQSLGKLSSQFVPGDFFDVTQYDHMSLYCYSYVGASGTLDDIDVKIERKPIVDVGFTSEQSVDYAVSGSFVEGRLRDIIYSKEVNYGDTTIREVGYPIDVTLTNTKQIRVSVRHKNGQTLEDNKSFIVYGRFIRSSKDTNET